MGEKTEFELGSHLLHCFDVQAHVTGETPELIDERRKVAGEIVAEIYKTGKIPFSAPQGVEIQVTINHGGGGGP